jgi:hypothetical protein
MKHQAFSRTYRHFGRHVMNGSDLGELPRRISCKHHFVLLQVVVRQWDVREERLAPLNDEDQVSSFSIGFCLSERPCLDCLRQEGLAPGF